MPNLTKQMNTLQSGGKITVESPDENARQIIQNMQARQGANVKIVRSKKGHFLGAVDLNDTSRHYISNMDQFDTALGIIKPYEQVMASDPRQAGQLGRKRNWKNRSAILNSVYLSQDPAKTRTGHYRSVYDAGVERPAPIPFDGNSPDPNSVSAVVPISPLTLLISSCISRFL